MISDKANLPTWAAGYDMAKVPRCADRIARLYRSKERLLDAAVSAKKEVHDRRAIIATMVDEYLGDASSFGMRCERYLRDAAYRWLLGTRSADTWRTYLASLWKWIHATGKRSLSAMVDTTPDEVMAFLFALEGADAAQRTIALRRDVLRSFFGWLVDRDLMPRSPVRREASKAFRVDHAAVLKGAGVRPALTPAEAQRVVEWALTVAEPIVGFSVLLELGAALRSAEVAAAEARHLIEVPLPPEAGDVVAHQLTVVGKGRKTRVVVLEPFVVAAYHRYWRAARRQGARGALLLRAGGGFYTPRTIQAWAKRAARVVGREEISSHDFRASCATLLRERGADVSQVQALLGHSSPVLTERCYVRRPKVLTANTGLTVPPATT
jgi:integrase/recombinase XerD